MMKKIHYLFIQILVAVFFQACDLERYPLANLPEKTFWDNESNADLALTTLYRGSMADKVEYNPSDWWSYHGMILMEHLSDNAFDRRGENNPFFKISSGNLTADNNFIKRYWTVSYARIGYCNRFLDGIQKWSDSPKKARMVAEARFLRATQYFYLASYFKDVPLVTTVLTGEEANSVDKALQAYILKWCALEFSEAALNLPRFSEIRSSESGRACKQAALAFLGRTCMLQKDWARGAQAFGEIIELGDNDINPDYKSLFYYSKGSANKENIFYIQFMESFFGTGLAQHAFPAKDGGWSLINPSAGLYEAYEFLDGSPFSYADSRYNPDKLGENRDPRLDYTVYYNGSMFKGTEYKISPDYEAAKKERLDYSSEASRTGFLMRKYIDEASSMKSLQDANGFFPVIRYAEVLLGYLECVLESGETIDQKILDATINKVRGRASVHMPPITETSNNRLREMVRNERRVELAMEGIRYWDLLRWEIAHEVLSQKIWGAPYPKSKLYATSTKEVDPAGHCRWYVGKRAFRNPVDYVWPIPQSEQNINPKLRK
ncbi:SusD family protein [Bacteroides pyogenes F0041]|uniref:SusD family protein n=2 Tax=Bacteroides pyogenes TaxID=310300 RepID=U2CXD9_9BACE|nr:SusD family protein [Bacteroides pyogenes F0041]MBB3895179.1 hypothetical protein [Bacteroides pyogenes]GAE21801.1 putative outer membrane protein [Bacteroides pyogenes JCM 10003]